MKNKNKWLRPKNPRITLKSGVQLSIQSGDGYQARPYTEGSFEVMVLNINRCPYGWHKYHQSSEPWSEFSVFVYVPSWFIAKYIDRQGISESQERGLPDQVWKHISI